MAQIHHFEHGWLTPAVSYTLSVLGSLLGLVCATRLRSAPTNGGRIWWLTLAAVAIGGTGIWTMHFVAMLGFSVVGLPIRYDVPTTALSAVIAVVAVGIGLFIAARGTKVQGVRLVIGGLFAGLGVAAMHFTGMYAMHLDGTINYDTSRVAAAVIIAVVAATVALWLAMTVQRPLAILASALVMGIAVNGMHFTGMSAMSVRQDPVVDGVSGAKASTLLIPIGLAVIFGVLGLVYALMAAPTDEDRAAAAYLAARLDRSETAAEPQLQAGQALNGQARNSQAQNGQGQNGQPANGQPRNSQTPNGQAPNGRRMPTGGASWTFRDREGL